MSEPLDFCDPADLGAGQSSGTSSAATVLARMVRDRVPDWLETSRGLGNWRFDDPEYPGQRYVEVEGRDRIIFVPGTTEPGQLVGPSLLGYRYGLAIQVTLPVMSDNFERRAAVRAAEAIDALPAGPIEARGPR